MVKGFGEDYSGAKPCNGLSPKPIVPTLGMGCLDVKALLFALASSLLLE